MNMVKRTWAEISLNAIEHNYNVIRNKVADDTKVCCVIKADGYGHGAVELSQVYEKLGADFFAVSNIDEGIEIRKSGSKLPIVILGYTPVSEAENLAEYDISQAVFSLEYAKELSEKCVEEDCICKMHIKVDSGMSRIGFMCQEFPRDEYSIEEICEACCLPNLEVEGLFTHFCVSMKMLRAESSQTSSMKTLFMCVTALKSEALISALFIAQTAAQLKITPKPVAIW